MAYHLRTIPADSKPQTYDLDEWQAIAELPPSDVVAYFRSHPQAANRVLGQSYDKRYSPSTFVEEADGGYQVGWFAGSRQDVQRFTDFSEAIADYLLFSFAKGRLAC